MIFFNPAGWFSNCKIPHKLLAISFSFLLPIGVMLYLIVQSVTGGIQFATFEKYGNAYQRPLEEFLYYLGRHENLVRLYSEKNERIQEQILNVEAEIDKAIVNLEIINDKVGKQLQFTDEGLKERKRDHFRVENVKAEWEGLKKNYSTLTADASVEQHQHLVTDIRTMITHCGDTSNLILDPDLDSYYLMDSTLLILPQTQNRLIDMLRDGEKALKDGVLTREERQQLVINAVLLKEADLTHIVRDATTYLNEDKNFYGVSPSLQKNIPPALQTYRQATQKFIELVTHIANSETIDPSFQKDFTSVGFEAIEESFRLWNIAVDELDILLAARISYYEHSRFLTLSLALVSLMISVLLVFFITKGILDPLQELMIAIDKIGKGNLTSPVSVKSQVHDEIAELSRTLNTIINNLRSVTASRNELDNEIIKRQQIEECLRASEQQSRSVIETAKDAFVSMNEEGTIIDWNREAERIFGWTRSEILGKSVAETIVPAQYREAHKKGLQGFFKTGEGKVFGKTLELSALHHDGHEFFTEMTIWTVRAKGKYQFYAFIRDITERKLAEKALKESEELTRKSQIKFRLLLDSLPQKVFYKDNNSVFVACNKAFAQDLNRSFVDIIGKTDNDFFFKELAEKYRSDDKQVMEGGTTQEFEDQYVRDGTETIIQTVKTPVRNDNGEVVGVMGIFWDITERKRAQAELGKAHQSLENAHKQLQDSMVQIIQAEKLIALGELTAGIAHELNQPLNVTKIICQGILRDIQKGRYSEEEAKNDLPQILKQMDKLAEIILHMRIFTRRSDKMGLEKHDINALVNDLLRLLRQQYKDHNVDLVENFAVDLLPVLADPIRIEQVCLNLLGNALYAVEHSGKSQMKIEIKTYPALPPGKNVVLEIADNGIGMTDDQKGKLFQPFFTTKAPGVGTGLGLLVSKKIIEEHGGNIEVSSQEGVGSVFRVFLPVAG